MGRNKDSEAHAVTSSGTQRKSCRPKRRGHKDGESTKEIGRSQVFALRWVPSSCPQSLVSDGGEAGFLLEAGLTELCGGPDAS